MNQKLDHAVTNYRIGYNFGWAEVKKEDGVWTMVRAVMNSIE